MRPLTAEHLERIVGASDDNCSHSNQHTHCVDYR
jgi:hypothetical protein